MAIDQAILESASDSPTLRFYGWLDPTLSLGYFQGHQERSRHPSSQSLRAVRRSTGGGAIVHHHELTYSLVMPFPAQVSIFGRGSTSGALLELYAQVHEAIITVLRAYGCHVSLFGRDEGESDHAASPDPFLCFQRRSEWDLVLNGYKILGSAQRRVRSTVLQHGSILLAASPFAPELPGIAESCSTSPRPEAIADSIAQELCKHWKIDWKRGSLDDDELENSDRIEAEKFANSAWFTRR